ncbi:hypothetical protein ACROYT_G030361 [Oculina patagonica]
MAAENGENVVDETKEKTPVWTNEKELTLLQNVQSHLESVGDSKSIYVKDIAWDEIAFGGFDEDDVHKRWNTLTSKIRKMRTAKEILEDAKVKMADKMEKKDNATSRKRKREDSALPKMPLTTYFIFCEQKRPRLAEKHTELNSKELAVKLSKKWKKLSEEKKQKYHDIYVENKKKYDQEILQYYLKLYPDEKPPKTAFDVWSHKKKEEIKIERPDISEKKMNKKLTKYWEKLEDGEKEQWQKKAKTEVDK